MWEKSTRLSKIGKPKAVRFNIMVVGETGSGKTTMLKTLFKEYCRSEIVRAEMSRRTIKTVKIEEIGDFTLRSHTGDCEVHLFDSPGYGDYINNQNAIETVKSHLIKAHREWVAMNGNKMTDEARNKADNRIHCVFYFIAPHRMKDIDREFITQLTGLAPIIPVIGKSDTMTWQERRAYLIEVRDKIRDLIRSSTSQLVVFDFEEEENATFIPEDVTADTDAEDDATTTTTTAIAATTDVTSAATAIGAGSAMDVVDTVISAAAAGNEPDVVNTTAACGDTVVIAITTTTATTTATGQHEKASTGVSSSSAVQSSAASVQQQQGTSWCYCDQQQQLSHFNSSSNSADDTAINSFSSTNSSAATTAAAECKLSAHLAHSARTTAVAVKLSAADADAEVSSNDIDANYEDDDSEEELHHSHSHFATTTATTVTTPTAVTTTTAATATATTAPHVPLPKVRNIFAVVCDTSEAARREYPWGSLDITDEEHSDFRRLQRLVLENDCILHMRELTQEFSMQLDDPSLLLQLRQEKQQQQQRGTGTAALVASKFSCFWWRLQQLLLVLSRIAHWAIFICGLLLIAALAIAFYLQLHGCSLSRCISNCSSSRFGYKQQHEKEWVSTCSSVPNCHRREEVAVVVDLFESFLLPLL